MSTGNFRLRASLVGGLVRRLNRPENQGIPLATRYQDESKLQRVFVVLVPADPTDVSQVTLAFGGRLERVPYTLAKISYGDFLEQLRGIPGGSGIAQALEALRPYMFEVKEQVSFENMCASFGMSPNLFGQQLGSRRIRR